MRRLLSALVVWLTVTVTVSGCLGEDRVEVPEQLISAETVDGTAEKVVGSYLGGAGAVVDDGPLIGSATIDYYMGYRRDDGDDKAGEKVVVIGASPSSQPLYKRHRHRLTDSLENEPEPGTAAAKADDKVARLPSNHPDTIAFSTEYRNDTEPVHILRSYTYLENDDPYGEQGILVMVSIEATGDYEPSPKELKRLTTAQIKHTQSTNT